MGYFIFRRSIQSLFSLVALVILVFFLSRLTGSPADLYLPQDATEEMRQQFDMQHGFDQPLYVQFGTFLIGLLHFDLGQSIQFSRPAIDVVLQAFPTTLMLAAVTLPIILTVAIVTGSLAAVRPGGLFDRVASIISLIGASTPNFWVAIVGVILFAVTLRLAADLRHRDAAALGAARGGSGAPPDRRAGAGGAQLDGDRARLGLRQDRAGQGRRQARRSSSCMRSATRCCPSSPWRATSSRASSTAR